MPWRSKFISTVRGWEERRPTSFYRPELEDLSECSIEIHELTHVLIIARVEILTRINMEFHVRAG